MLLNQNEGILYPENLKVEITPVKNAEIPKYFEIPHKALDKCKEQMEKAFSLAANLQPQYVFVLAPLHKGKVNPDDAFRVYSYRDCFAEHPLIEKNDCVCSEEFSYEIALPYIKSCFPNAKSTAFFAPGNSEQLKDFVSFLRENYKPCVIFVSNNSQVNCSQMWLQAL